MIIKCFKSWITVVFCNFSHNDVNNVFGAVSLANFLGTVWCYFYLFDFLINSLITNNIRSFYRINTSRLTEMKMFCCGIFPMCKTTPKNAEKNFMNEKVFSSTYSEEFISKIYLHVLLWQKIRFCGEEKLFFWINFALFLGMNRFKCYF